MKPARYILSCLEKKGPSQRNINLMKSSTALKIVLGSKTLPIQYTWKANLAYFASQRNSTFMKTKTALKMFSGSMDIINP